MIGKYLAVAAFAAGAFLLPPLTAQAKDVDVDVNIGVGGGYGSPGYPVFAPDRISCWQGVRRVRWAGFYNVKPLDCSGRLYTYRARRGPGVFLVTLNSFNGRIVRVR